MKTGYLILVFLAFGNIINHVHAQPVSVTRIEDVERFLAKDFGVLPLSIDSQRFYLYQRKMEMPGRMMKNTLYLLDRHIRKTDSVDLIRPTSTYLVNIAQNKHGFALLLFRKAEFKVELLFLDNSLKQVGSVLRSDLHTELFNQMLIESVNTTNNNNFLMSAGDEGFINVRMRIYKRPQYLLEKFNNRGDSEWVKHPLDPDSVAYIDAIKVDAGKINILRRRQRYLNDKNPILSIDQLDARSGEFTSTEIVSSAKNSAFIDFVKMPDADRYVKCYLKIDSTTNNYAGVIFDLTGQNGRQPPSKEVLWRDLATKQAGIAGPLHSQILVEDFFVDSNGTTLVAEEYSLAGNAVGVASHAGAALNFLVLGVLTVPKVPLVRLKTGPLWLVRLNKSYEVVSARIFPKESTTAELPVGAASFTQSELYQSAKRFRTLDFEFFKPEEKSLLLFYKNRVATDRGTRNSFEMVRINGDEILGPFRMVTEQKISSIYPGPAKSVFLVEYDNRAETIEISDFDTDMLTAKTTPERRQ
jgi:hypothetical protein